jgi:hypothetical protein
LVYSDPDGLEHRVCDANGRECVTYTDKEFDKFLKGAGPTHQNPVAGVLDARAYCSLLTVFPETHRRGLLYTHAALQPSPRDSFHRRRARDGAS